MISRLVVSISLLVLGICSFSGARELDAVSSSHPQQPMLTSYCNLKSFDDMFLPLRAPIDPVMTDCWQAYLYMVSVAQNHFINGLAECKKWPSNPPMYDCACLHHLEYIYVQEMADAENFYYMCIGINP